MSEEMSDLDFAFRAGALWRHMNGSMDGLESAADSWSFLQERPDNEPATSSENISLDSIARMAGKE
jgi:hypothetical protein